MADTHETLNIVFGNKTLAPSMGYFFNEYLGTDLHAAKKMNSDKRAGRLASLLLDVAECRRDLQESPEGEYFIEPLPCSVEELSDSQVLSLYVAFDNWFAAMAAEFYIDGKQVPWVSVERTSTEPNADDYDAGIAAEKADAHMQDVSGPVPEYAEDPNLLLAKQWYIATRKIAALVAESKKASVAVSRCTTRNDFASYLVRSGMAPAEAHDLVMQVTQCFDQYTDVTRTIHDPVGHVYVYPFGDELFARCVPVLEIPNSDPRIDTGFEYKRSNGEVEIELPNGERYFYKEVGATAVQDATTLDEAVAAEHALCDVEPEMVLTEEDRETFTKSAEHVEPAKPAKSARKAPAARKAQVAAKESKEKASKEKQAASVRKSKAAPTADKVQGQTVFSVAQEMIGAAKYTKAVIKATLAECFPEAKPGYLQTLLNRCMYEKHTPFKGKYAKKDANGIMSWAD